MRSAEWDSLVAKHLSLMHRNPEAEFSKVDPKLWEAVKERQPDLLATGENFYRLWPNNFGNRLRLLMTFEKLYADIQMRKFDQHKAIIRKAPELSKKGRTLFQYELFGLSKGHPKLVPGDVIILDNDLMAKPEMFVIEGIVGNMLKFSRLTNHSDEIPTIPSRLSFLSQGIPYQRCTRNLQDIQGVKRIQLMLFNGNRYKGALGDNWEPESDQQVALIDAQKTRNIYVDGRLKGHCNELQRQAILNIMEAKCRPRLYILYGPPGTGKTATLIEAAGQVVQRDLNASVLICAKSNNCVDDLTQKMLSINCIRHKQIVRLCSMKYFNSLLERGAPIPDFFTDNYHNLADKRIVITTNMMTPKLNRKFDYVLMDEAGHATIPETLLPCSRVKEDGCFVLAGDPKQLGPVVQCRKVAEAGLGVSLLKRLFGECLYGQHDGKYNPRYITKLVHSYRSDPRLMALNNREFYRDELQFGGKTPVSLLKMLKFDRPLVFKRISGKAESLIENYSPSWMNELEADWCIEFLFKLYMMGLEPDQIGVITYYSLQKAILMEKFEQKLKRYRALLNNRFKRRVAKTRISEHTNFVRQIYNFAKRKLTDFDQESPKGFDWHCKIDTIDAFQGNEREVIIISTTLDKQSPFLNEPTRFNVATSRAKWLTVIAGHQEVLNFSKLWRKLAKEAYLV